MKLVDKNTIDGMEQRFRAQFINGLSGYKSANLIGTQSQSGVPNLAIFSSVFHLGADPALMGMISRPDTVTRDTLSNIKELGCYTINHVNEDIIEAAHQSSARYEPECSEFEAVGLTPIYQNGHLAPYVKESFCQIGLKLREFRPLEINKTVMVIGEIVDVSLPEIAIRQDGSIDYSKLNTIALSGLDEYHKAASIKRLSYAKVGKPLVEL